MISRKRTGVVLLAGALLAAMATPGSSGAAAESPPGPIRPGLVGTGFATSIRNVTLITGDRVTVSVDGSKASVARIAPGKGRSRISFFSTQVGGHLRVIPSDALPLLHANRVDPRLFDVTDLLKFGYDDRRPDLPLIVTGSLQANVRALARNAVTATAMRDIPGGTAIRPAKTTVPELWRGLTALASMSAKSAPKVWLDGIRHVTLDQSVPQIGAPAAWAAGYTGAGVTVGVVDTGIDSSHPDLVGQVIAAQDFTGADDTRDYFGHGTHVAATIASHDSRYRGVAFGAHLLSAKVCDAGGGCGESSILAGMQWAAQQGAKIINMSLGGADTPGIDPIEAAVADLTAQYGALFVVAAGNAGGDGTIESPGSADDALTVGAVTKQDDLADFSSRGPRIGDGAIKPDITAPGVDIVAARSSDGSLGNPGDAHLSLSGTSMATPHVAGAAALLLQEHPSWTPAQLKEVLMGSALSNPAIDVFAQGAGRVDVAHAIAQPVLAESPSVSFGTQLWPHTDDVPITHTVTYRNVSGSDVTLNLSLTGGAPAGIFTLSAGTLSVPAGGTASVNLTSDTRVDVPDARYTGYLIAQSGTVKVAVPFGVDKEVESHNVTVRHLDRSGQPTADFFTGLFDPSSGSFVSPVADGQTIRVPKGRYQALSGIFGPDATATMLIEPDVVVDRDVDLTMDARDARPVSVSMPLPLPGAVPQFVVAVGDITSPIGDLVGLVFGEPDSKLYVGSPDPDRSSAAITSMIVGRYTKNGADPVDSAYLAQVMWREHGRMFQGFTKRLTHSDLAVIHAEHAADTPTTGFMQLRPAWPEGWTSPIAPGAFVKVPGTRVEYYNTDDGIRWLRTLFLSGDTDPTVGSVLLSFLTRFEGGKQYNEKRNFAVYGPGFSPINSPEGWISRLGDTLSLLPNVVNDRLNWFAPPQPTDSLRMTLDRNGQRVFDGTDFAVVDVAPGDAQYRLDVEMTRHGLSTLSTSVSCVWTFRSNTVQGGQGVPLPLSAVRFLPQLDDQNTAPAGRLWQVPVQVQQQQRSAAGTVKTLVVEVSYDDGATWQQVTVIRHGQNGVAFLNHPAGPGYVSLRATSTDTAGNTVSETIIRAYRIA